MSRIKTASRARHARTTATTACAIARARTVWMAAQWTCAHAHAHVRIRRLAAATAKMVHIPIYILLRSKFIRIKLIQNYHIYTHICILKWSVRVRIRRFVRKRSSRTSAGCIQSCVPHARTCAPYALDTTKALTLRSRP